MCGLKFLTLLCVGALYGEGAGIQVCSRPKAGDSPSLGEAVRVVFTSGKSLDRGAGVQRAGQVSKMMHECLGVSAILLDCLDICGGFGANGKPKKELFQGSWTNVQLLAIVHNKYACNCRRPAMSKRVFQKRIHLVLHVPSHVAIRNFHDPIDSWTPTKFVYHPMFSAFVATHPSMQSTMATASKAPALLIQYQHSNFYLRTNPVRRELEKISYFGAGKEEAMWGVVQSFAAEHNIEIVDSSVDINQHGGGSKVEASVALGDEIAMRMAEVDLAVVWNQCGTSHLCLDSKPPQRLLNHWSVGLPTVVFSGYDSMDYILNYSGYDSQARTLDELAEQLELALPHGRRQELSERSKNFSRWYASALRTSKVWLANMCCTPPALACCNPEALDHDPIILPPVRSSARALGRRVRPTTKPAATVNPVELLQRYESFPKHLNACYAEDNLEFTPVVRQKSISAHRGAPLISITRRLGGVALVIGRCCDDVRWLSELECDESLSIYIYDKCSKCEALTPPILPHLGKCLTMTKLLEPKFSGMPLTIGYHSLLNYNSLPPFTVFMKGEVRKRVSSQLHHLTQHLRGCDTCTGLVNLADIPPQLVRRVKSHKYKTRSVGAIAGREVAQESLASLPVYCERFQRYTCRACSTLSQPVVPYRSQYIVSRERIQRLPRAEYEWMVHEDNRTSSTRALHERSLPLMFGCYLDSFKEWEQETNKFDLFGQCRDC
ncbi:hypothetical protein CYMTET_12961 [Cymbomonas tetramitiformis]|uniref:Uncharacterized protein n=1 Tax=Cymbomonas tetramitiformis TaxID=36881 RepID=A0AAE0GJM8_9CHLO|nr:hypothetical protein CYMTET_12961 [Cymbomonas tetramitiformis]|eukprot:gene4163-5142_t